ncbi:hypothetical protein MWU58_01255 [Flavobacteriaceae bacterium S0825]|uniref:hypothetical protein n=1 Tax=Gaetbulibacter sp. S0825 TaxID=2720084 RepID=UPI00142F4B76|nr:hypothetical protein [Gaetbulibacter sp. S0825]MCK0107909.1 hypothetical protein [Flavobacteriaceae bacterium S0825]NIX63545.1 hypothetical protein [Gaetbulibacter sp. S0825]
MKKIIIITSFLTIGFANYLQAQFTQVELFSGYNKTDFTLYSSYAINESKTLNINTLAFFQKFNDKEYEDFDEVGIQPTLFWSINKNITIGPSLYYNSVAGYSERLSAKITLKNSRIVFVIIPTIAHSEQTNHSYAEAFAQFQFNKPINDKISFWFNCQFLTVWDDFKTHSRSFQQLRAGVSYKGHQLGIGLDFDQYGQTHLEQSSFGVYYRKTL